MNHLSNFGQRRTVYTKNRMLRWLCILILPYAFGLVPCAAVAGTASVMVGWEPSPDYVAGYDFCYGTSSGNYDYTVDVGNVTSCSISGLEEGETYYFAARAYDAAGNRSELSKELVYKIPAQDDEKPPPAANKVTIWLEAEEGDIFSPMEHDQDARASSGNYIWVPDGNDNLYSPSADAGYVNYNFSVPATGTYWIWGRVIAGERSDDSFFVSIDDGEYIAWHTQIGGPDTWIWDQVRNGPVNEGQIFSVELDEGEHRLTIMQREDETKIDKILISNDQGYVPKGLGGDSDELGEKPDDPAENIDPSDFKLYLEAENGDLFDPFEPDYDSKASSGQFAWVPNGSGNSWKPNQNSGHIEYNFEVPAAGDFVVWGRVKARNGRDNSFFVAVDGGAYALWDTRKSKSWVWDAVSNRGGSDPIIYHLEAGEHTLIIKQREDGTKLDKILITGDLAFIPQ